MSKLTTDAKPNGLHVTADDLMDVAIGNVKQVFLTSCEQFGDEELARQLLIHEGIRRNNINASSFLARTLQGDYRTAIMSVGEIVNDLNNGPNYVSFNQQKRIKRSVANLYREMKKNGIKLHKNGFIFPDVVDDSQEED